MSLPQRKGESHLTIAACRTQFSNHKALNKTCCKSVVGSRGTRGLFSRKTAVAMISRLRLLNLFQDFPHGRHGIAFQHAHVVDKLADVQFPLSRLDFRHQRLRSVEFFGELLLSQFPLSPCIPEDFQECFPLRSVEGFCQAFFQRRGFTPETGLSDFQDNRLGAKTIYR